MVIGYHKLSKRIQLLKTFLSRQVIKKIEGFFTAHLKSNIVLNKYLLIHFQKIRGTRNTVRAVESWNCSNLVLLKESRWTERSLMAILYAVSVSNMLCYLYLQHYSPYMTSYIPSNLWDRVYIKYVALTYLLLSSHHTNDLMGLYKLHMSIIFLIWLRINDILTIYSYLYIFY